MLVVRAGKAVRTSGREREIEKKKRDRERFTNPLTIVHISFLTLLLTMQHQGLYVIAYTKGTAANI
jgi:hypothetical protein